MFSSKALGAVLLSCAALVACGGGGSSPERAGTSPFGHDHDEDGATAAVVAADIVLELSKSTIANSGSDSVAVTLTAVDSARRAVAGARVRLAADADAILSAGEGVTDASGRLQSTLTIGANKTNRTVNLVATSSGVTRTAAVQVTGARLTATLLPAVISPGSAGMVQFRLVDAAGTPMVAQAVRVVAPSLTPAEASGTTGFNGDFDFRFTAPPTPGAYVINATASGAAIEPAPTLQVQAVASTPAVTVPISSASVSANPSVVGTNTLGSTANRSEIRALFLTSNNQPVQNVRVRFDSAGDANSVGGSFSTGSTTLYSDASGVVTTTYIPGTRSSPTDGVTVRACYYTDDASAAANACATSSRVTLTVSAEPLGVSIGTNSAIIENELTYVQRFVVSVVDSAGVAKPDVTIAASLDLPAYRKGFWTYDSANMRWLQTQTALCGNEDGNRNGVLESVEDANASGRLEPGKSDVSVTLLQSKTRSDGTAEVQIQYAKSFGSWLDATVTVAASGVLGTEGRASAVVPPVGVPIGAVTTEAAPPFVRSPYGIASSCSSAN